MDFINYFSVIISRKRWLKRIFKNILPSISHYRIFDKIDFYFDPRDMRGPSFHFAYDLEKGFLNYEQDSKKELLNFIPDKGVFFDIGANIGLYSFFMALNKPSSRIFCFEPNKDAYNCLSQTSFSLKENNLTLVNKALGKRNEEKKLYRSFINDGGHTLNIDEHGNDKDKNDFEVVNITTLDDFFTKNKLNQIDAIKIDVEGFELEVVLGALKTIKKFKPFMLIESSNKDLASKGKFWQFFKELEVEGLFAREPATKQRLNLLALSHIAQTHLNNNIPLSNYFFQFD